MLEQSTDFPRVLVVGPEPFNYEWGVGITISNLFTGWPKDRLACLHPTGIPPDDTICEHHYGFDSRNLEWPLVPRLLTGVFNKDRAGSSANGTSVSSSANSSPSMKGASRMGGRIKQALGGSGVGCLRRVRLSEDVKDWVVKYQPDLIYCSVTNLTDIEWVLSVAKLTQAAIVTHTLDDWIVVPCPNENVFQQMFRRYTHLRLRRLYRQSSVCLAIGEEMSRVYLKRYGIEFLPFFNCPDAEYGIRLGKREWRTKKPFRFVFSGGVYRHGNHVSLVRFAEAIELVHGSEACTLEIYCAKAAMDYLGPMLQGLESSTVHLHSKDTETAAKLRRDADALVLTLDFGEGLQSPVALSMPTRLTPFLLSGTPIFALVPSDTALGRFCRERQTAFLVDEWMNVSGLAQRIKEFMGNEDRRKKFGLTAQHVAVAELAGEVVRPRFREMIRTAFRRHIQSANTGH